jgi:hypothetical protein
VLTIALPEAGVPSIADAVQHDVRQIDIAGFVVCVLLEDNSVGCANANESPPVLHPVLGLPQP